VALDNPVDKARKYFQWDTNIFTTTWVECRTQVKKFTHIL